MNLGDSLFHARRKQGLSQEAVAEQLGVSRQTVSKWEANETLPDIRQSKLMAKLYHTSLDELIEFDPDVQELQEWIDQTPDSVTDKIDWTQTWAKKYPILVRYQSRVNIPYYAARLNAYEMEESSSAPSAERRPLKQPAHPNAFKRQKRALVSK